MKVDPHETRVIVDGEPLAARRGERLLVALLRAERHPTGGGCLCLAGDCPSCLATVDGIGYTRTCQVAVRPGMLVEREHLGGERPPLLRNVPERRGDASAVQYRFCDVVVLGQGAAGREAAAVARAEGRDVVTLDAGEGQEVLGVYAGPLVVARTAGAMLRVRPHGEIIVATGAAEIQPVAPGTQLAGLVTARAATLLADEGLDLGRVVAVGAPPEGVDARAVSGEPVRFEGEDRLEAVVVSEEGVERRYPCDTVSLGLGLHPRDALARMGRGMAVRLVGDAAGAAELPPPPREGVVCPCSGVTVADLDQVWEHGFEEMELLKRATLAGTGTCQGQACLPHLRSFLRQRGGELQPPFTARPVSRQPTIAEIAAGGYHQATPRTALDEEHRRLGARMERVGGWWRPWSYGDPEQEYWAVREAVSVCDVGTLGKMLVSGPDALRLLEHLFPTRVSTLAVGRCRYALLLDERGYVLDDGLICRDGENRYSLTFTSGGATLGELWVRDWAESLELDVRLLNQTMSLGAINVTGPLAAELLARGGVVDPPRYTGHSVADVAGVPCRIFRLSFTGELSYELHHPAAFSVALWRRLLELGQDLGIRPHGVETLLALRLEKGHLVVGQDTDFDSTPRRLGHGWAVKMDKEDFVGRAALVRTDKAALDRQLVGLEMPSPAPIEGAVLWHGSEYAGYVTSSADSRALGKAVMLAWLRRFDGELPTEVIVESRTARRVPTPFYDPEASRARAAVQVASRESDQESSWPAPSSPRGLDTFSATATPQTFRVMHLVADPVALDCACWPPGALVFRLAPDEALVTADVDRGCVDDADAIAVQETGLSALWRPAHEALAFLRSACSWRLPEERPAFAQGAVAGLPLKLWLEEDRVLFVVPSALAAELAERLP